MYNELRSCNLTGDCKLKSKKYQVRTLKRVDYFHDIPVTIKEQGTSE